MLSFFQRNPYAVGRAEDIATCLGVGAYQLAVNLEELVESGILHKKEGETAASYAFKPRTADEMVAGIMDLYFATACRWGRKMSVQSYPSPEVYDNGLPVPGTEVY